MTADPTIEAELMRLAQDVAEKRAFAAMLVALTASLETAMHASTGRERRDRFLEADIAQTKWFKAHAAAAIAYRMFREALVIRAAAAGAKAERGE